MDSFGGLLFPLLILLLFIPIFLSGRKQRAQAQQMQQLQSALEAGDVVTTTSGLRGTVVDASYQDTIDLEIADGVVTTWLRAAVREKVADATDATDTGVPDDVVDDRADDRADPIDGPAVVDRPVVSGGDGTASTATAGTARPGTAASDTADGSPATPSDANGSHRS